MQLEEYKKKIAEVLQAPLTTDAPETLYKEAAVIESLAYLAVKLSAIAETKVTELDEKIRTEKLTALDGLSGTQMEKTIQLEAKISTLIEEKEKAEIEMKYWKGISKTIENKVSLAQSILSNIGSQMKSGMYFNNIK